MKVDAGKRMGVGRKLLVSVLAPLVVLGGGLGILAIVAITSLVNENIDLGAMALIENEATHIESFLEGHGTAVDVMLANDQLISFFETHRERQPIAEVNQVFRPLANTLGRIASTDASMRSCFFASAYTGEYFDATGLVDLANYDARQRWWWPNAVEAGELFVQPPASDADTGDVVVAIKTPVYVNGRLLGIAGVDVDISEVGERIAEIKFEDTGSAFLVADDGLIVYFSELDLDELKTRGEQLKVSLGMIDEEIDGASGFADIGAQMVRGDRGRGEVELHGERHFVVFAPVQLDHPRVNWSLGLAIPKSVVTAPVRRSMAVSVFGLIAALVLVGFASVVSSRKLIVEPLQRLAGRLRDIAEGRGDLTQTLESSSTDEFAELAELFNRFIGQIRSDITEIAEQSKRLKNAALEMSSLGDQIGSSGENSAHQMEAITTAAQDVSQSLQAAAVGSTEMDASIREIAERAAEAASIASQAVDISQGSISRFGELGSSADRIGAFVKVIQTIAEQTNLLALNATIEAARAGEAGKGFAVVANEVKELAGQAGEASTEIRTMVESIQEHSASAAGSNNEVAEIIEGINDIQIVIATAVEEQSATTAEISRGVNTAASSSSEIADNIEGIAQLARSAADSAATVRQAATNLSQMASRMEDIVERFTY